MTCGVIFTGDLRYPVALASDPPSSQSILCSCGIVMTCRTNESSHYAPSGVQLLSAQPRVDVIRQKTDKPSSLHKTWRCRAPRIMYHGTYLSLEGVTSTSRSVGRRLIAYITGPHEVQTIVNVLRLKQCVEVCVPDKTCIFQILRCHKAIFVTSPGNDRNIPTA